MKPELEVIVIGDVTAQDAVDVLLNVQLAPVGVWSDSVPVVSPLSLTHTTYPPTFAGTPVVLGADTMIVDVEPVVVTTEVAAVSTLHGEPNDANVYH